MNIFLEKYQYVFIGAIALMALLGGMYVTPWIFFVLGILLIGLVCGWKVLQSDYLRANEDKYYEDKFAVLLSKSPLDVLRSIHLGHQPLESQPFIKNSFPKTFSKLSVGYEVAHFAI